jgi:hypothetical protein
MQVEGQTPGFKGASRAYRKIGEYAAACRPVFASLRQPRYIASTPALALTACARCRRGGVRSGVRRCFHGHHAEAGETPPIVCCPISRSSSCSRACVTECTPPSPQLPENFPTAFQLRGAHRHLRVPQHGHVQTSRYFARSHLFVSPLTCACRPRWRRHSAAVAPGWRRALGARQGPTIVRVDCSDAGACRCVWECVAAGCSAAVSRQNSLTRCGGRLQGRMERFRWLAFAAFNDAHHASHLSQVVKGSHKLGLLSRRGHTLTPDDIERVVGGGEVLDVELQPGDCFFCHNWTVHRR